MTPDRWQRVVRLYEAALERPSSERAHFLAQACGGDADLQREVESLFAQDHHDGPLDRPVLEAAAELLGDPDGVAPGTRLGPYRLERMIGSGGMGEVYRATDTRLDRTVAVKILPSDLSTDAQFRERFDREAKAVAALSHPHICAIFDVGHHDGVDFLVLEYLEGVTLAARLEQGALPVDEALQHAVDIADALATAHRHGIVHRDLKPANIFLTKSGAKLLDFGLARATVPTITATRASGTATAPETLTAQGTILGTFQYMAPEQLEGQTADARTDIFAFGAVVYEMLTGTKAFNGKSQASLIGAILKDEPPAIDKSQPLAPPVLDRIVRRCLTKDPEARWQSAADLTQELKWMTESHARETTRGLPVARRRERVAWTVAAVASTLLIALVVLGAWLNISRAPVEQNMYRSTVVLPPDIRIGGVPPVARLAISPDARRLVYVARDVDGALRLWIRALDKAIAQPLAGTEGAWAPFWSPDSRSVAFFTATDRKLKRVDADGGPVVTVCDLDVNAGPPFLGGSWNRDGVILFSLDGGQGILRVPASGGTASVVTTLAEEAGETRHGHPAFLPDGRHFLYLALGRKDGSGSDASAVYVASIDSSERKRLLPRGSNVSYASGHLLFLQDQTLMAQPFDTGTLELRGEASPIVDLVHTGGGFGGPFAASGGFSVSDHRVLAFSPGEGAPETELLWFDRQGRQFGSLGEPASYFGPELSPDGTRAAVTLTSFKTGNDIWLFDVGRGLRTRLTVNGGDREGQIWSPDGSRVLYRAGRDLRQKETTGAGRDEVLLTDDSVKTPADWSADGRFVLYLSSDARRRNDDLFVLPLAGGGKFPLAGGGKPVPLTQTSGRALPGRFSPDARWIAYASNESGRSEVMVTPFPGPGAQWQVSTAGGVDPRWRRDGREIFYVSPDGTLMAAPVSATGSGFVVGAGHPLFKTRMRGGRYQYDVRANGNQFLVNTLTSQASLESIELVVNWTAALRK